MGMSRAVLDGMMQDKYDAEGQVADFQLEVPAHEMPAVLMILKKLQVAGRVTDYRRREAQNATGRDDVINIYGYTPAA